MPILAQALISGALNILSFVKHEILFEVFKIIFSCFIRGKNLTFAP